MHIEDRHIDETAAVTTAADDAARVITPDGERIPDPELDRWLADVDDGLLRTLHSDMVLLRRLDDEGIALQRQGQLALWPPARGQEATQIGTAHALRPDDFAFTSYREHGILLVRGATPEQFVLAWRGEEHSAIDPADVHVAPAQIIIGAQTLHAVGYAMGVQRDGGDQVAAAYFGDGATSQGDVNEAMVFASSFRAPVVFLCANNQYAISEPVRVQSAFPIAGRSPGFGIPSMRVDGNDVLACLAAMRWASSIARSGSGPAFIEAVTYRMGPHTTSDDPTRYRTAAEVQHWATRDPITRFETLLRREGVIDDAYLDDLRGRSDALAAAVREAALSAVTRDPLTVFDHVYAEPHTGLDAERTAYAAYLAGFADDEEVR